MEHQQNQFWNNTSRQFTPIIAPIHIEPHQTNRPLITPIQRIQGILARFPLINNNMLLREVRVENQDNAQDDVNLINDITTVRNYFNRERLYENEIRNMGFNDLARQVRNANRESFFQYFN